MIYQDKKCRHVKEFKILFKIEEPFRQIINNNRMK
jgi:hypothetical protein